MYNGGKLIINKQLYFGYALENNLRANAEMKLGAVLVQCFFSSTH
jgi:hypothetical protein